MAGSALSRRVSEFIGVALFALALIWLIALASYSASDPVWFFNTGSDLAPAELRRARRRLPGRVLLPAARLFRLPGARRAGRRAAGTTSGAGSSTPPTRSSSAPRLLLGCTSSFLSLAFGTLDGQRARNSGRAATSGSGSRRPVRVPQPDRVDHPDPDAALPGDHPLDAVLVRAPVCRHRPDAARSVGRGARLDQPLARGETAREAAPGRPEEAPRRQGAERTRSESRPTAPTVADPATARTSAREAPRRRGREEAVADRRRHGRRGRGAEGGVVAADAVPSIKRPAPTPVEAALPLADPDKMPAERKKGATPPHRSRCSTRRRVSARSTSAS